MIWSKKYETGNTQVDNEHKEIFKLVQDVIDVTIGNADATVEDAIDFLANYTVHHFKHEENLMHKSNYSEMAVHKKQHDDFVAEVLALRERVKNESDTSKNNLDIKKVVVNWLTDHVLGSDKVMADYYRKWLSSL
ncbi:MAG: bacteriohemerythrin [Defluviitaleaceae bacterium]|nr:bacteriohemerythrin [Defluviitaleaceae bacterium]